VDEVLEMVGLAAVGKRRIKSFSLGMSQRLGIAATMLGDPEVLMFDEPVNGLDPEGILWIRNFMRALASQGRTVFVSSHLMSEMAVTADHLIVIGRGRLIADVSTKDFIDSGSKNHVRVRSPQQAELAALVQARGVNASPVDGYLEVGGMTCDEVGDLAAENHITIHELFQKQGSLEEAFMELTRESVEYHAPAAGTPTPGTSSTPSGVVS
jgi:ABC-2 type transport system ATP-binding protein